MCVCVCVYERVRVCVCVVFHTSSSTQNYKYGQMLLLAQTINRNNVMYHVFIQYLLLSYFVWDCILFNLIYNNITTICIRAILLND